MHWTGSHLVAGDRAVLVQRKAQAQAERSSSGRRVRKGAMQRSTGQGRDGPCTFPALAR